MSHEVGVHAPLAHLSRNRTRAAGVVSRSDLPDEIATHMYRHCLFCHDDLGTNEVIEPLPVGRRVAFDERRARLWVVCRKCERWNLTPFDERLEAIEACERAFRGTRLRVSTDQIGLARVSEGLELVRIGDPLRPEMAAWRYGDQFGRRRKRQLVVGGVAMAALVALQAGASAALGGAGGLWVMWDGAYKGILDRMHKTQVPTPDGRLVTLVPSKAKKARVKYDTDTQRLHLSLRSGKTLEHWYDGDALAIAALVLPKVNLDGGNKRDVARAVEIVSDRVTSADPVGDVLGRRRLGSHVPLKLGELKRPERLALEMALHEEQERRALEGELKELELRWAEAEAIANIADSLTLPPSVESALDGLKKRSGE